MACGLSVIAAAGIVAPAGRSATGERLRSITAANPGNCGSPGGVAFDGTALLLTCTASPTLDLVRPADGGLVRTLQVQGVRGLGAAAWDAGRGRLWACETTGGSGPSDSRNVVRVDPTYGTSEPAFATAGCEAGVAYDATNDSLWVSPGASQVVYHYGADGRRIGQFSVVSPRALLGGATNSGIAVGGGTLYLATPGGEIYGVPKDFAGSQRVVAWSAPIGDLECDSSTFAGRTAVWSQPANRVLSAFEVPEGTCGTGGRPEPPVAGRSVVYRAVSGRLFIRYPRGREPPGRADGSGARAAQATGFLRFAGTANVPLGSVVDARRGRVEVTSAADLRGRTQRAEFFSGIFETRQRRSSRPTTEVAVRSSSFSANCRGRGARSSQRRRVLGRLFAKGKGRFRTRGRFSAATIRGTVWLTEERCDGTLTRVSSGRVSVRDLRRQRTVVVRAGRSYLARAQRASLRSR
jgi:hypothetical protein